MADPAMQWSLLDELNIVLRYDYLPVDEVVAGAAATAGRICMSSSPAATRREALIEAADLVTEMTLVKHPFRAGVKAQPGVEF